jgi:2-dehydro-3-deoxyglucarate aldolase/4-hydroxy-2-oxoheptanedioate aldolase
MVEAIEQVRDACLRHGLIPGIHNRSTELAQFWKERGMKFIGCSNDTAMLFDRASEIIKKLA